MKITRVETIPYSIPYVKPLRFASGEVTAAEHVLVRVHTDDGLVGTADAPPRPFTYGETQSSIVAVIKDLLGPQLEGLSPLDREAAHARMARTVGNPAAKAAIDIALWDLIGQSLAVSVTELLGGYTDRMRAAHMVGFASAGEMVDDALRVREQHGITTFKVKVGRRPVRLDVTACRALREALGEDAELYIDGNRGWTAAESARALHQLEDVGLLFAEEPCPADDIAGLAMAGAAQQHPDLRRRERVAGRRGDPGDPRRFGDRCLHQDRAHRIHPLTAYPPPVRRTRRRGGHRKPDRRPDRLGVQRGVRRRLRGHLSPRR